jgi:hypothetical protein
MNPARAPAATVAVEVLINSRREGPGEGLLPVIWSLRNEGWGSIKAGKLKVVISLREMISHAKREAEASSHFKRVVGQRKPNTDGGYRRSQYSQRL